jgi:hypothetical protein
LATSRSASFIPRFLIFFLPFFLLAGDIGQMNLPVGMQSVNFEECSGLKGTRLCQGWLMVIFIK